MEKLAVNIIDSDLKIIARAVFPWGGYTDTAGEIVSNIIEASKKIDRSKDRLSQAIDLLESSHSILEFEVFTDREEIEESLLSPAESSVYINIDKEKVAQFDAFFTYEEGNMEEDDYVETGLSLDPTNIDFSFFEEFRRFLWGLSLTDVFRDENLERLVIKR